MPSHDRVAKRRSRVLAGAVLTALAGGFFTVPAVMPAAAAEPEVPGDPVISSDTVWRYLDDGVDPIAAGEPVRGWVAPEYDDSTWKSAEGSFGAKKGKLASVGPHMPKTLLTHYQEDGTTAIPTYLFRTDFTLEEGVAEEVSYLSSKVTYDDALVVWINGTQVADFEAGRVTGETNMEYAGNSNGDPLTNLFTADGSLLKDGKNTVAVALYQDRESSSDIFFDMSEMVLEATGEVPVEAAPSRVVLTPTETPETSQAISWLAGHDSHKSGAVEIGLASGGDTRLVEATDEGMVNANVKHHFSAIVTGLEPATAYRYRVGTDGGWSDWREFSTADPNASEFQFIYYGDAQIGLDTTWPSVVKQAEERATASIGSVHAGDLIDKANNETQWENWFLGMLDSGATTNVMAAPGNHEYSGDKLMTAWKANFEYPRNNPKLDNIGDMKQLAEGDSAVAKQYRAYFEHWSKFAEETVYFTDYQGVRFITLNATRDSTFLKPDVVPTCISLDCPSLKVDKLWTDFQAAWLDNVLKESPSKWNVVTFHQPVFSASSGRDEPILRAAWLPVFEENDIDLVLMGHDHVYARGYLNSNATDTEGLRKGPAYVVSNSGAKHYDLAPADDNVWTQNGATQVKRDAGVTTYQVIDVEADRLVYRSYLAETSDKATTEVNVGELYDEFTVTKYDDGEKWVTEPGVEAPAQQLPASVTLDVDSVEAGKTLTLTGAHFAASEKLTVTLGDKAIDLASIVADAAGAVSTSLTIPADTEAGTYTLTVSREQGEPLTVSVEVTAAVVDPGTEGPGGEDPGTEEPGGENPGTEEPGGENPGTEQPGTEQPGANKPGAGEKTPADDLANTGGQAGLAAIAAVVLLALGGTIMILRRRVGENEVTTE
ncbi:metallophosphoesterase family protein [Leucobacter sp. UCMA 4100]|uniref:purple acid phosphatase family protein n=1 Tax=Leucobacter sp. UCMA 4100 TaxID=2810534 RepID=UPI0022EA4A44|nr:metallophosphoesterase family protein [Leucobacter sp. UCMA 4100]MDA3146369.1 metallophosphoesterase family protein [Leucobacter sp. UCMA 4100]